MLLKSLYTSLQEILEQQYDHYHQDDQEAAGWRQRAGAMRDFWPYATGAMQLSEYGPPRIHLPRRWVNKGTLHVVIAAAVGYRL